MAKLIASPTNALDTRNIANVIRNYSSTLYQTAVSNLPENYTYKDVMKLGETILGAPALANEFIGTLVNRVALAVVQAMTFNNKYKQLKKGYLEFGELVEDIFVGICELYPFEPEKAEVNELKNWPNDVRTAFYAKNFSAQYRNSISMDQLKYAFTTQDGLKNLVDYLIQSMYTAMEYDDMLLVKYLIIKKFTKGEIATITIPAGSKTDDEVAMYRGIVEALGFPKKDYNAARVLNTTPIDHMIMIRPAMYGGEVDVKVDAVAFNLSKTEFLGRILSIDDFTTFDNERFAKIVKHSNSMEPVTDEELALMAKVKTFIFDDRWFQIYDNLIRFTSTPVNSGLRWNNFLTHEGTVAASLFYNAIAFVDSGTNTALPETVTITVQSKTVKEDGTVFTLVNTVDTPTAQPTIVQFANTTDSATKFIGITPEGIVAMPTGSAGTTLVLEINGKAYKANAPLTPETEQGVQLTFTPEQ